MEDGKLEIEGVTIDTLTELVSKLSFAKEDEHWESASTQEGDYVVAVDCTQDESILSAGKSRELINHIQQLRKSAGLDLKDVVEAFFLEEDGVVSTEKAVAGNVSLFKAKFKGSVPLPKRFAPEWSVELRSETVEVGGFKVNVAIARPAVAAKDDLASSQKAYLATVDPLELTSGAVLNCCIDNVEYSLKEGQDFWTNTVSKLEATNALEWL